MKPQEHNPPFPNSENSTIVSEAREAANSRHSQRMKRHWQNPAYREQMLTKLHGPEAKEKYWQVFKEDPNIRKRMAQTIREHKLEQLEKILGGNPKVILEDLHIRQGLSAKDIATRFHKATGTIQYWFKILGITPLPYGKERRIKTRGTRTLRGLKQLLGRDPKQILEDLYFKRGLSAQDIADRFHKGSKSIVYRWFKNLGITTDPYKYRKKTRLQNLLKQTRREAKMRLKEMNSM